MDSNNISATNQESRFGIEELFVSRTNKQGVILSGNDVFARVSGYEKCQLIGKPHNIIRHPDMPRCVFRLLWNTIQQNKVIVAYVKNRAIDGRYYWVLATIFPTADGYISTRLKPSSPLFEVIKELYAETLIVEFEKGVDASTSSLLSALKNLGFPTYETFMIQALKTELDLRDQAEVRAKSSSRATRNPIAKMLIDLNASFESSAGAFRSASNQLKDLLVLKEKCEQNTAFLSKSIARIQGLAVNMSISAHKMGKEGSALAVVASTVQSSAQNVNERFELFSKLSQDVSQSLSAITFSVLCSRVKTEMLSFMLNETLANIFSGRIGSGSELEQSLADVTEITKIVATLCNANYTLQKKFAEQLSQLGQESASLHAIITRLDLIRAGGKLEGFRSIKTAEIFGPFIKAMDEQIQSIGRPISNLVSTLSSATSQISDILAGGRLVEHSLTEALDALERHQRMESTSSEASKRVGA